MPQAVDSETDDSRTRYFGSKRALTGAEGEDTSASTPSKRSRRNRPGPQNYLDFVPKGGSFSQSGQIINAASPDGDNSSDSSAASAHDPEGRRTSSTAMQERTNGLSTSGPRLPGERPVLGRNRLITGFAKTVIQPSAAAEGEISEASRNDSTSHNSIGESADDAIEISDDTDMEGQSDDGGMLINVDDESDDAELPNITKPVDTGVHQFRILGWRRHTPHEPRPGTSEDAELDTDARHFCELLERKSTLKHLPNLPILNSERVGKWLIISVRSQDAEAFADLDGRKLAGKKITVHNVSGKASIQPSPDISDGEIDERLPYEDPSSYRRKACSYCDKTNHTSTQCYQRPKQSTTAATQVVVKRTSNNDAHEQLQGDVAHSLSKTIPLTGPGSPPKRLGELSSDDFEKQVKYTLFHLKRDQIDLDRLAICTTCLQEGHQETSCPESNCLHCGARDEHPSRMCPKYRRCLKCRERGHDVDTCISKLKNTTVPCDHCGSEAHLEDRCSLRFFPSQSQTSLTELKLWISCCVCASKTHLVGDCPERRPFNQAMAWSLRPLNPMQVSNLSLESGTRKFERDVEIRGAREEDLIVKDTADPHAQVQARYNDNDRSSLRPSVARQEDSPRRGGQTRPGDRAFERDRRVASRRHDVQDDLYRPSSDTRAQGSRYDRYESSYTDYREQSNDRRDKFYATDSFGQRRRSRSPDFQPPRGTQRHDLFQPPLPKEPLPNRQPPPSRRRPAASAASNLPNRPAKGQGPPGVDSYRPMPSAARRAWDKHRF